MHYCAICGTVERVKYRPMNRMFLCEWCHETTPAKIGYGKFCEQYFGKDADVPECTKKSFYDDYKKSECDFEQYVKQTVEPDDYDAEDCLNCGTGLDQAVSGKCTGCGARVE